MRKANTLTSIKEKFKERNLNFEIVDDTYVNAHTPLKCKCKDPNCNHEWEWTWNQICFKSNCPKCIGFTRPTIDEFNDWIQKNHPNKHICVLSENLSYYGKNNRKRSMVTMYCSEHNHTWETRFVDIKKQAKMGGMSCRYCNGRRLATLDDIKDEIKKRYNHITLLSDKYEGNNVKLKFICNNHDEPYYFEKDKSSFFTSPLGCPICGKNLTKGENHYNYNPNLTDEDRMARDFFNHELRIWREFIFDRDNYICTVCGDTSRNINAHHLDGWGWCEEKRFDTNNGTTLCVDCHKDFHYLYGNRNNTKEQFEEFFELNKTC